MTDDEAFALLREIEADATSEIVVATRDAILVAKGAEVDAIAKAVAVDVLRFRAEVRKAASTFTGLTPTGADDTERGEKAGAYVAKKWADGEPDGAAERAVDAAAIVGTYEVFDAWNDEVTRAIASLDEKAATQGRWVAKHDKKVCPECDKLNGALSDNDGSFSLPGGKRGRPPLHASCRCFVATHKKSAEETDKMATPIQKREMVGGDGALALKSIRESTREVDFVASTDAVDSYGDVIDQESWQLSDYLANPIVLYGHQSRDLPIGRATNVGVRAGKLEATVRFASADANPEAEKVWKLIQEGVLRAVSVGFLPTDGRYEMRGGNEVFVWRASILKEISVVPIPANPEALAKMKSAYAATHKQLTTEERVAIGDAITAKYTNTPATPPAATTKGGDATKETKMDKDLQDKIEAQAKEIGTLTVERDTLAKTSAATTATVTDLQSKIATISTEKSALEAQNAALVVERDAMKAKLAEVEEKAIEVEVEALVGVKIKPEEKALFVDLRKQSPDLFSKMVAQRDDMKLLGPAITAKGAGAKATAPAAGAVTDLLAELNGV